MSNGPGPDPGVHRDPGRARKPQQAVEKPDLLSRQKPDRGVGGISSFFTSLRAMLFIYGLLNRRTRRNYSFQSFTPAWARDATTAGRPQELDDAFGSTIR